ncbi:hypothetical protein [Amycolatopsis benzoatilytica]|uniref:hypothetical protein n=1 Tax=Amycolatopsis benzoatilytica TaxID=346045 RepID=UPI000380D3AD|nr:hypothetical protein [Amycolatopsis benzoatilytica]
MSAPSHAAPLELLHKIPCPSEAKNRAEPRQIRRMTKSQRVGATCMFCGTIYRNNSPAYRCEHWHVP